MKKTIGLMVLLILILLTLTGCAQLNYTVEINRDGSGEISYVYGISKVTLNRLGVSVDEFINEMKEQAQEGNYQVETYEDDDIAGFRAIKHINDFNTEFSLQEAFGEEYVKDTEENGIKVKKGFFTTKYAQTAELDLSTIDESERSYITMFYQVKVPTKVTSTNANEVSEDGKTLKWNLTAGIVNKIEFNTSSVNKLPILICTVIFIVIVVVIIILKEKYVVKKTK